MNFISQMFFQDQFEIIFHCWLNNLVFFHSPGVSHTIHGGSHLHSQHLKTEEEFLFNLALFSSRFMVLACCHPLIIVSMVRIFFTHQEIFKSLLSLSSGVHQFRFIHSQPSVIILLSCRCIYRISSNQFLISLFSCI